MLQPNDMRTGQSKGEGLRMVSGDGVYDQWVWKGPATDNATKVYKPAGFGDGSGRLSTSFLSRCHATDFLRTLPKHILRKTSDEPRVCHFSTCLLVIRCSTAWTILLSRSFGAFQSAHCSFLASFCFSFHSLKVRVMYQSCIAIINAGQH